MDPTRSESGETVRSGGTCRSEGRGRYDGLSCRPPTAPGETTPTSKTIMTGRRARAGNITNVALSGAGRKLIGMALVVTKEERPYEPAPPRNHRPGYLKEA